MLQNFAEKRLVLRGMSVYYKVDFNTGCWNVCNRHIMKRGYSLICVLGRSYYTHRLVYIVYVFDNKELPTGIVIMHKCDNPRCINPEHLVQGTQFDNVLDRDKKGRHNPAKGVDHGNSKLSEKDVILIRQWYYQGFKSQRELAKVFEVSQSAIFNAVHNYWQHIK